MADRVKLLIQKRTSLKSQITNLANLLDKGRIDNNTLKLRMALLTDLYTFEEFNDKLAGLDPSDVPHELSSIQEQFYILAGNIENKANVSDKDNAVSNNESRFENAT